MGDSVDSWHIPVELHWTNVAYNIDRAVVTESQEDCVAWSEEFVQTSKDELCSTNFKLCMQEAVSALSTNKCLEPVFFCSSLVKSKLT